MARGRVIRPQEIGVLASLGHETILVHRRPRVAILATGDELLECKNFGVTSLNEIREKLVSLGLKLRGE